MKLLVVAPYFYPKAGGLENYAYNISKGLKDKYNWDIVVITSNHKEKKDVIEVINGLKIYRLASLFIISNTPINPFWVFKIKKIIRKEKPDSINVHTPVPFISDVTAFAAKNIPVNVTYHAGSMIKNRLIPDIFIWIYQNTILKLFLMRANKIICVSEFLQTTFLSNYLFKTVVIPPGVDINLFKPNILKKKMRKRILCIGGLRKSENYKRLTDIFSAVKLLLTSYKNLQVILIGGGDNIDFFKKLSKRLNISQYVTFKGELVREALVHEYQKANVVVLPSVNESFGTILIEAMACKVPVIGAKTGGIPEIITHGKDGFLITQQNIFSLRNAINEIFRNDDLAIRMGESGYIKVINNFTWDKQIKKTFDLLRID